MNFKLYPEEKSFSSQKQRRAIFPVDVVPPSLHVWSIFIPVFFINRLDVNFIEVLIAADVGDHFLLFDCRWYTIFMNHLKIHVYACNGDASGVVGTGSIFRNHSVGTYA